MADEPGAALSGGDEQPSAALPALSEATLRAVTERVYELMRDDLVVQRERRGLAVARWR